MDIGSALWRQGRGWETEPPRHLDSARTLVLAFASPTLSDAPQALQALASAFPTAVVAGCSTAGEIHGDALHDGCISVAVVRFAHTALRLALTPVASADDSAAAGGRLAAELVAPAEGQPLTAVLLLGDGTCVNGTALTSGLAAALPAGAAIAGGLAGDGSRFQRTWVFDRTTSQTGHALAVGLYGDRLHVASGCEGGWQDFGPARRISRAQGAVLHELDGQPALDLYRRYLGERAAELPGAALLFPLSVRPAGSAQRPLVRTILGLDESTRSMTFAGDVPAGWEARLMRSSPDRLIDSAAAAATQALEGLGGDGPALLLAVSCVGRRLVLGERSEEELEATLEAAPPGSVQVGFYSYGEIARGAADADCRLHNQTMAVTALRESA
jgi:hypothetical protein